jgi:hypothetical protein
MTETPIGAEVAAELGHETDWPAPELLTPPPADHVALLAGPDDEDEEDPGPDVEAQARDVDPEGDPTAEDPGVCDPPAEVDPKPILAPDALDDLGDVIANPGEDLGDDCLADDDGRDDG